MPASGEVGKQAGLADILRVARAKNAALEITGVLVLYDDWFTQVLEGSESAVTALCAKIKADARHDSVELDSAHPVSARLFVNWSIAC